MFLVYIGHKIIDDDGATLGQNESATASLIFVDFHFFLKKHPENDAHKKPLEQSSPASQPCCPNVKLKVSHAGKQFSQDQLFCA